jgi:hypothetical protein
MPRSGKIWRQQSAAATALTSKFPGPATDGGSAGMIASGSTRGCFRRALDLSEELQFFS